MSYLFLGFFTGLSLILAIGAQNIFVIEQGLKKQHIFLVCFICSISDLILIFIASVSNGENMGLLRKFKSKIKKAVETFSGEHSDAAPEERIPYKSGEADENVEVVMAKLNRPKSGSKA